MALHSYGWCGVGPTESSEEPELAIVPLRSAEVVVTVTRYKTVGP